MKTSNFRNAWSNPNAVAICRFPPPNFTGRRYPALAPPAYAIKMKDPSYFGQIYRQVLEALDPRQVYQELGPDAVLLCYEPPGEFCHRRLAAEWLEKELRVEIPELEPGKPEKKSCLSSLFLFEL